MSSTNHFQERAIFLAAVCEQTYAQFTNTDGAFTVPAGYSVSYTIQAKSITQVWERFGFILESPQEIIVAFRGSSSMPNWISNANASQKQFKYIKEDCLTHRGFTGIYSSARNGILSLLDSLSPDKTLYITGHSLGGALATLCAVDIAANSSFTAPRLYTFASPRVGDPAFAKACAKYVQTSYRIANPFDIVTHAPPSIYKLPRREKRYYYSHVQSLSSQPFQNGAINLNHILSSYFAKLSKPEPEFTEALCTSNPGFCPVVTEQPHNSRELYAE
ncbi:lipase family protein [Paenibacillus sp. BAC0078]